jgi:dipeptidyl aminopeptidase/acylaminoacyl peptidase
MPRRLRIDDLYRIAMPQEPTAAPDGSAVVYALRQADRESDRDVVSLWRVGADGTAAHRLTAGPADSAPAYSPDGTQIAFLRATEGSAPQIWLLPAAGGEAEQLTTLPLGAGAPVWSPDGARIAFSAAVDPAAADRSDEERASAPLVADRLDYLADGAGFTGALRAHLHVVDLADRKCVQLTEGFRQAGSPAWSPDGSQLAFVGEVDLDSDRTFRSAVFVVPANQAGADPVLVGPATGMAGTVSFTPDGEQLLVVGTIDTAPGLLGLLRVPLDGGEPVDLAAPLDRNVMPGAPGYPGALPTPTRDGKSVLFCARDGGVSHLYSVAGDGTTPPRRLVGEPGLSIAGLAVASQSDLVAAVRVTPTSYGEIVSVGFDGSTDVLTSHGSDLADEIELYEPEPRRFTAPDGRAVHGWVLAEHDRDQPGPLLLDIHGGPHNAWSGTADPVHLYHQVLVEAGWTVLTINPRGSDGYGADFYTAVVRAWGESDAADFTSAVDALVADGTADPDRLAVTGYSYGGYMTCFLTSRDDRFAAAIAGGPVTDLASAAGTSDLGHYMGIAEFGALSWTDPERLIAQSPMSQVDQVQTPTLVLHGLADVRCPIGQAQQWFAALRARGVPARLVAYPDASHLFILGGRPSHRVDYNERLVDWVQRYAAGR